MTFPWVPVKSKFWQVKSPCLLIISRLFLPADFSWVNLPISSSFPISLFDLPFSVKSHLRHKVSPTTSPWTVRATSTSARATCPLTAPGAAMARPLGFQCCHRRQGRRLTHTMIGGSAHRFIAQYCQYLWIEWDVNQSYDHDFGVFRSTLDGQYFKYLPFSIGYDGISTKTWV